ncbi:hypothetical protein BGZ59_003970 [Podila verticillata]|nr:hypothetical protein BGZ59_003970 [Podila verticillata]
MCPTPFYRFLALRPFFCVTYPGENDICAQTNTCTCNGNKPAYSLQFQPACNRKICGYAFQQSCKLDPDMLLGPGGVQNKDAYTNIFVGDLKAWLEDVRVRMSTADGKGNPTALGDAATLGQLHINVTMNLISWVNNKLDLPANIVSKLEDFKVAMDNVAMCSSANTSTCPDMDTLLDKNTARALKQLRKTNLPADKVAEVEGAVAKLKSAYAGKNQADLDSAAETLNRTLIEYKLSTTLNKNVSKSVDMIIQTGTDALNCRFSFNIKKAYA